MGRTQIIIVYRKRREEITQSLSNHRRRRLSTSCCQRCGTLSRRKATRCLPLPSWKHSRAPTTTSTQCPWRCWSSSWTPTWSLACQRPRPRCDWRGTAPTPWPLPRRRQRGWSECLSLTVLFVSYLCCLGSWRWCSVASRGCSGPVPSSASSPPASRPAKGARTWWHNWWSSFAHGEITCRPTTTSTSGWL